MFTHDHSCNLLSDVVTKKASSESLEVGHFQWTQLIAIPGLSLPVNSHPPFSLPFFFDPCFLHTHYTLSCFLSTAEILSIDISSSTDIEWKWPQSDTSRDSQLRPSYWTGCEQERWVMTSVVYWGGGGGCLPYTTESWKHCFGKRKMTMLTFNSSTPFKVPHTNFPSLLLPSLLPSPLLSLSAGTLLRN